MNSQSIRPRPVPGDSDAETRINRWDEEAPISTSSDTSPRERFRKILIPAALGAVFVGTYLILRNALPEHRQFLLPSVSEVWQAGIGTNDARIDLLQRSLFTGQIAFLGLGLSVSLGILLGVFMYWLRSLEAAFFPYLVALQAIPILAIAPLIQTAFGFGLWPKVFVAFLISLFAIPTSLLVGLKSTPREYLDLMRLQGVGQRVTLTKVAFPNAIPSLFTGFRIAAGLSVIGAIVGELFFRTGTGGLGQLIINAKIDFRYPQMYAALIAASVLGVAAYSFFSWLNHRLIRDWHESAGTLT